MSKNKLILVAVAAALGLGISATVLFAYHQGVVSANTPYITLVPGADARVNEYVAEGAFKLYRFPVVTDDRPYTIVVEPVSGRPELYASRYEPDVDELKDMLSWWCDDDHCGQSASYDGFQVFTFYSPTDEPNYYSWFAVYGDTASAYSVRVTNEINVVRASSIALPPMASPEPIDTAPAGDLSNASFITWFMSPEVSGEFIDNDFYGNPWYSIPYLSSGWSPVELADNDWNCAGGCSKFYRGKFRIENPEQNLYIDLESDDGLEIYVNSQFVGQWGGAYGSQLGCVNYSCVVNKEVAPINIRSYLRAGENVVAVRVYNSYAGGYFNLDLTQ